MHFGCEDMPLASAKLSGACEYAARIEISRIDAYHLKNALKLFEEHMNVEAERTSAFRRRSFLSLILSVPFRLLGKDTFISSMVKTDNGQVIGAVFARRFPFGKSWVVGPIVVHRDFRGSGVATPLMNFTLEHLRRRKAKWAILSVETGNIRGRSFFEKSDFKYFGPIFADHEKARKYVQSLALTSRSLQNTAYWIDRHSLQPKIAFGDDSSKKPEINGMRTWRVMFREL